MALEDLSLALCEFDIDDDLHESDSKDLPKFDIEPAQYVPRDHSLKWFLNSINSRDDIYRDRLLYKANFSYHMQDFSNALQSYKDFLVLEGHSRNYQFAILDSVIRSMLKCVSVDTKELLSLVDQLSDRITSYSEQLQYWRTKVEVLLKTKINIPDAIKTIILLCSTIDICEHWLLFDKVEIGPENSNLHIGSTCHALRILKLQEKNCSGFAADITRKKMKRLRLNIKERFLPEEILKANKMVGIDYLHPAMTTEQSTKSLPRYCGMKGMLKKESDQIEMMRQFFENFSWIFEDQILLISSICHTSS